MKFVNATVMFVAGLAETMGQALSAHRIYFDLNSKSDFELAKQGIARSDIPSIAMQVYK
jgi:uncharacterized protein YjiS (DUF1127 family)